MGDPPSKGSLDTSRRRGQEKRLGGHSDEPEKPSPPSRQHRKPYSGELAQLLSNVPVRLAGRIRED